MVHGFTKAIHILLLSVYSPFSDRVGLPLHNIPSPFLSVMNMFFLTSSIYIQIKDSLQHLIHRNIHSLLYYKKFLI